MGVVFMDKVANKQNKIDIGKAIKMKYINGMTEADISRYFKCSTSYMNDTLKPFANLFNNNIAVQYVSKNMTDTLRQVTANLLLQLADKKKLKEASLNNIAYSFSQVAKELHLAESTPTDLTASALIVKDIEDLRSQANQLTKQLREEETPVDNL